MTEFSRITEAQRSIRVNIGEGEFHIMVNPTEGDLRKLVMAKDGFGRVSGARGVLTAKGDVYVWSLQRYYEHNQFFKQMDEQGAARKGSAVFYVEQNVHLDDVLNLMGRYTRAMTSDELVEANNFVIPGLSAFESVVQGKIGTGPAGTLTKPKAIKHPSFTGIDFFVSSGRDNNGQEIGNPTVVRSIDGKSIVADFNVPGRWAKFKAFIKGQTKPE